MTTPQPLAQHHHNRDLLIALVLLLILRPFLDYGGIGEVVLDVLFLATLLVAVRASVRGRSGIVVALAVVGVGSACKLYGRLAEWPAIEQFALLAMLGLLVHTCVVVGRRLFVDSRRVTVDSLCGAVAIYIIVGVIWAALYAVLEHFEPGSFHADGTLPTLLDHRIDRFFGFSFFTLTTVGYGNIAPATPRADALCSAEAIIGPLYISILIARLLALHIAESTASRVER